MTFEVFKTLHILGIALVFLAFGGLIAHTINGGTRETNKKRGLMVATHGLGLVLIIGAGFGMLSLSSPTLFPGWIHPKLLIWLLLGGLLAPAQRSPKFAAALWWIVPLLATVAGFLAITHK